MMVTGVVLYCAKLETKNKAYEDADLSYDASITNDISAILADKSLLQDVIKANHSSNSDVLKNPVNEEEIIVIDKIFDNFFELYNTTLANHNRAKNVEIIVNNGAVKAVGSFGSLAVNITGQPRGVMQRNANGEQYLNMRLLNLEIPYIGSTGMNNHYYFSGSKYYANQFYVKTNYTKRGFQDAYNYSIGDLISNINPDTASVDSFVYDEYSERYTAKITFNEVKGESCMGMEDYTKFLSKATENARTGGADVTVENKSLTIIISKNCQFIALASAETWNGVLTWQEMNLNIKLKLNLSMLWTFRYPKTLKTGVYTF